MKIRAGFFSLLLGIAALSIFPPELYGEEKVHIVQKGETFFSIARAEGVKVDDLMRYNGMSDPARLQAGQRLRIPGGGAQSGASRPQASVPARSGSAGRALSSAGAGAIYRVIRGDTFFSIARKYSVTVAAIREANSLPGNYILKEGDSLKIPGAAGSAPQQNQVAARPLPPSQLPDVRTEPRDTESRTVNSSVRWPVAARELSYMNGKLSGVVITGARAEPVKSLTWGTVLSAGPYRGFGRVAIIQVEGGYLYVYGGCESLSVKEGDKIDPGTELGKLGIDAVTNKPQLFFMVYKSNAPVDPAKAPRA